MVCGNARRTLSEEELFMDHVMADVMAYVMDMERHGHDDGHDDDEVVFLFSLSAQRFAVA